MRKGDDIDSVEAIGRAADRALGAIAELDAIGAPSRSLELAETVQGDLRTIAGRLAASAENDADTR